jgi:hypothetical protein
MLRRLLPCLGGRSEPNTIDTKKQSEHQYEPSTASKNDSETCTLNEKTLSAPHIRALPTNTEALKTIKALCVVAKHTYAVLEDMPYPVLHTPDELVVRIKAVGLNPIDWKSVDYNFCMPSFPWVGGREATGVVEQIGEKVKDFSVGDTVWTSWSPIRSIHL